MTEEHRRIVYLDVATPALRASVEALVPPGFHLTFADAETEEEKVAAVANADYVLLWAATMPASIIDAAKDVRLIQKVGEGTDRIDVAAATQKGIVVAKTSGNSSDSVAEGATMLILAALRWLPRLHNDMLSGKFSKFDYLDTSHELRGKQVGIVGIGKIGISVAEQLQGFSASLVYYDVVSLPAAEEERLHLRRVSLEELLQTSDVITLHVPLIPATRGMIDARAFSMMKPTATIVNTCRGQVIDEEALYDALLNKRIRAAAIDALWKEPPDFDNPFFKLENVIWMPHCTSSTIEAAINGFKRGFENILLVESGKSLNPLDVAPVPKAEPKKN